MSHSTTSNEQEFIKAYLENAVKHYNIKELECELRSGLPLKHFNGSENEINFSKFRKINKFYENFQSTESIEIVNIDTKHSLDISVYTSNYKVDLKDKINNLRFTLNNKDAIREYCLTNKLPNINSKNMNIIYKQDFIWEDKDGSDSERLSRIKALQYKEPGNKRCIVDLDSLRTRLSGKVELKYDKNEFSTDIENVYLQDLKNTATTTLNDFKKKTYKDLYKTYRLKERTSYKITYDKVVFRVDLTKVKESKKSSNSMIRVQRFIDSEIASQNEKYEYEIELVLYKEGLDVSKDDLRNEYIEKIQTVLNHIIENIYIKSLESSDDYPTFTPYTVQKDIIYIYKALIADLLIKRVQNKRLSIKDLGEYRELKKKKTPDTQEQEKILEIETKYKDKPFEFFNIIKNTTRDLEELDDRYHHIIDNPRIIEGHSYISPKVVSIDMDNVRKENQYSICHNYTVTDKADGLNMLLFKVGLNHFDESDQEKYAKYNNWLFLIDGNFKIYQTHIKATASANSFLFNGEYLIKDKDNKMLNKYGVFDCYIFNGMDVCNLELMSNDASKDTRLKRANAYFDDKSYLNSNNNKADFDIFVKDFKIATEADDIFKQSNLLWEKYIVGLPNPKINRSYKLDGLIYTPANLPVGYRIENLYGGQNDYDLKQDITWRMNLKWKPPHDNTIDFLLKFEQDEIATYNGNIVYKDKTKRLLINTEGTGEKSYKEFKIANLYNGDRKVITNNPCRRDSKVIKGPYKPSLFKPTHPPDNEIYKVYIPLSNKYGNPVCIDAEGDIIDNNTIVEVSYTNFDKDIHKENYISNPNLRWNILRTRHDKTFQYKNGLEKQKQLFDNINSCLSIIRSEKSEKSITKSQSLFLDKNRNLIKNIPNIRFADTDNSHDIFRKYVSQIENHFKTSEDITVRDIKFGNDFSIANNIWMTIHNPVTTDIITTGNGIPSINDEDEKYYNKNHNWERNKSVTLEMQNFHNKVIKNRLLLGNISDYLKKQGNKKITLLDLACGKGGDIPKWRDNGLSICVGIDIISDNILNPTDGACERYNYYKKNPRIDKKLPEIYFLKGDVSKNINSGEAFTDSRFHEDFRDLWNMGSLNTNFSHNKFDIISIMFAIHYFFESKEKLDQLIDNIDTNLKKGGFLIGTCFDGKKIFDLLSNPTVGNILQAYKAGQVIWKIKKKYSNVEFKDDESSLGLSIDVLIFSINKLIPEFLVNFEYLIKRLDERGIKYLSDEVMTKMDLPESTGDKLSIGSFEDVFGKISKEIKGSDMYTNIVANLSEEERKFSFLFKYFIFRKKTEEDEHIDDVYNFITNNAKIFSSIFKKKQTFLKDALPKVSNQFSYTEEVYKKAILKVNQNINKGTFQFKTVLKLKQVAAPVAPVAAAPVAPVAAAPVAEPPKAELPVAVPLQESFKPPVSSIKLVLSSASKKGPVIPTKPRTKKLPNFDFDKVYKTWKDFTDKSTDINKNRLVSKKLLRIYDIQENWANVNMRNKLSEVRNYLESLNKS